MEEFKEMVKLGTLKWFPFIGDKYLDVPAENRMLIIGESHYNDGTEGSISSVNDIYHTKVMIEEDAMGQCRWPTKIMPNFHKAMFREDDFSKEDFWNLISYYNFIQRPMHTLKDKPSPEDFNKGWKSFFELIKITKPKVCVFIGVSASNYLISSIQGSKYTCSELIKGQAISKTYGRSVILKDDENNETKIVFIKHTSMGFSWINWHHYLKNEIGDQLTWLEKEINIKHKPQEYYDQFNFEMKQKLKEIHSAIDENKINLVLDKKIQLQGLKGSGEDAEYFNYSIEVNKYFFKYEVAVEKDLLSSYYYDSNGNKIDKLEEKGIQNIIHDNEKSEEEIASNITDEILKIIHILKE
jgi:hypothetical protein